MQMRTQIRMSRVATLIALFAWVGESAAQSPPLRVWGELAYDFRFDDFGDGEQQLEHVGRLRLNGATYIWKPWLAQINAGVGINIRDESRGSEDQTGLFTTGDARLRLFPASRFPFEAFFERSDSDVDGDVTGLNLETTRYGAFQRYTTEDGTGLRFRIERTESTEDFQDEDKREDTSDLFQFGVSRSFDKHNVMLDSNYNRVSREDTGDETRRVFASLRHQYRPRPQLSIEDLFTFNQTEFDRDDTDFENRVMQLNSFAFWRPESERPLLINGTLRYLGFTSESGSDDVTTQTVTATVGGNYEVRPRWTLTGNVGGTQRFAEDEDELSHFQRAGLRYTSDDVPFAGFTYAWSGFAEASNTVGEVGSSGDREGSVQGVQLDFGHDLNRQTELLGGALSLNLGQNVVLNEDTDGRSAQTMLHNTALSWNRQTAGASTYVRLSASDARTFGGGGRFGDEDSEFQIVNFQLSREQELSRSSTWSGNLTFQGIRQVNSAGDGGKWRPSASADLTYRHQRLFGVPNLRFRSTLRFFSDAYFPLLADPQGPNERENKEWENRLEYTIGRLDLRLIAELSEFEDMERALVLFQIRRRFGDF